MNQMMMKQKFLYQKYDYSCPITIEVVEDDYVVNNNYKETKELIETYLR